ncbi:PadR family transcriptional regulator [Paraburkholderia antibiotica]|uniref:PadR family transcriptional regulator n=1 Tax=Paraburkholderia antibiotica TaxID=2728839 RepID=A0A7X9ZY84_9BURK|nr:PadR family transcriptional regulator [Paraburkholderia antibiotica]NML32889.1 PadR family transcriptional regulator [Paraburkholderia antibiotica]
MRHPHRFSGPRGAHDRFHGGFDHPSLRALWHAFMRYHPARSQRGMDFERAASASAASNTARAQSTQDSRDWHDRAQRRHHGHGHPHFHDHTQDRHATGRHHDSRFGGRGGRFGGGPGGLGGFGGDGDGFPRGRKFSSDDLQLLLLSLIDTQPSHGYELIKALEARSNGFYTPSPGMVYPALTYLEELGYVSVQLEGNRKRYALSDAGREYLAANRERVELMFARLTHIARKMDSVRRAFAGEEPADVSEGGWLPELNEARRTLKNALLRRDSAPADEQRRIAAILMRAAREIEGDSAGNTPNDDSKTAA